MPIDVEKLASMTDEELMKLSGPPQVTTAKSEESQQTQTPVETPASTETTKVEETPKEPTAEDPQTPVKEEEPKEPVAPKLVDPSKKDGPDVFQEQQRVAASQPKEETPKEPAKAEETPTQPVTTTAPAEVFDYKAAYERVMAPFKANNKTIKLESIDEAIQLMQMGANYTKKMQEMQSVRKFVQMLQNNGLLDEAKLSFLIDLDKRNPEAIKKLLVDAKIDPVELDTSKVDYKANPAHAVSDQEAALKAAIDDLSGQDGGPETLQSVEAWDKASQRVLWDNPDLLNVIHTQRIGGIYAKITAEMERRQMLGQLSPRVPFLTAYKAVGDELAARGAFGSAPQQRSTAAAPVAVRPVTAKTPAKPEDSRVKAAAPTRTSPRTAQPAVNYLDMSDEEFMKIDRNRRT